MALQKPKLKPAPRTKRETTYKGAAVKNTSGIVPKTDNQSKLIDAISSSCQVIVFGPAGTGKTYVTTTMAADLYTLKKIDKIVITRPMISVGKDIGILPGDLGEKVAPWALPVLDVLVKHLGKGAVETGIKNGNIENGDVQQTDLKDGDGLTKITHLAKKHMLPVPIVEFNLDDIVRSDICAQWVRVFYEEKI